MTETTTQPTPAAEPDHAYLLERLATIGNGNPRNGFGFLCAKAEICSNCCQRWDDAGECDCTSTGTGEGA